jgi:hypothetical protein
MDIFIYQKLFKKLFYFLLIGNIKRNSFGTRLEMGTDHSNLFHFFAEKIIMKRNIYCFMRNRFLRKKRKKRKENKRDKRKEKKRKEK